MQPKTYFFSAGGLTTGGIETFLVMGGMALSLTATVGFELRVWDMIVLHTLELNQ